MDGPTRQLEGLFALIAGDVPDRTVPGDLRSERISFNQINKKTGSRIRYLKGDADTGEEVPNDEIVKG